MILDSYNSTVLHLRESGDGLVPGGLFRLNDGVTGAEIRCMNSNNHQITWRVLGAALYALEDFMNEHQIWSGAIFDIYDGENRVGVGSIA